MPLNYRRNYKTVLLRRRIITISVVAALFLLISGTIIYFKYGKQDGSRYSPDSDDRMAAGSTETENTGVSENADNETGTTDPDADSTEKATRDVTPSSDKHGLALKRPLMHLYTIGIAKMPVPDVNLEYTRSSQAVDDSYFDDALFIGDSRTEGFMMYSSLTNINAYCSKGLSITKIYEDEIVTLEDGRTVTVMDALREQSYAKIYIMFGVNELGWPYDDLFEEQYAKVVYDIKQLQPDALIYVENIIPISAERSATDDIYNNTNVYRFNAIIEKVCRDQNVIYLDVASALADENGALPADASTDGIHCNGVYCDKWLDYLKQNTYTVSAVKVGSPQPDPTEDIETPENTDNTEDGSSTEVEQTNSTEDNALTETE